MVPGPDWQNQGLGSAEAAARLAADGANELPTSRPLTTWRLLLAVAAEPMFLLLLACGAIYTLLGDRGDALMLLGFVFIAAAMTFFQRRRSERSLAALRDMASPRALVIRDGRQARVAGRDLVVGDLVMLAEGDRVPADIELFLCNNLTVDESMLTGESVAVMKQAQVDGREGGGALVHAGTLVTSGTASGRVLATGARSAIGRIGASLATLKSELTPIQRETRSVVSKLALASLGLAAGLGIGYWWLRGDWLHGLLAGLTLAMAILPEELPVILTLFLGLGAWRLAQQRVLARSIPAIELLGATTVLCVDKTGTLTSNRMALARLWTEQAQLDWRQAPGLPTAPAALPDSAALPDTSALAALLDCAALACHRSAYDPMEAAIAQAAAALPAELRHQSGAWQLAGDYPLSPQLLAMSRVWQTASGPACLVAAKGAPEAIITLCRLTPERAARIAAQAEAMAQQGLRVLGVASAAATAGQLPAQQQGFDFTFIGLLALADPIRPEVASVVAQCQAAGVRVVMITGDHAATAMAIARQAGIGGAGCVSGAELDAMDELALQARLAADNVFCRIAPQQKLRLVQALRRRGEVVAMTGDGVNDAPALKAADIGVAMGARGTDVAREAAALVLLQDDFSALPTAIAQGRRVFANLRKALVFIVAVHVPIVGLSVLPLLWDGPMLLMPVHILFLQIIIDPACSIIFEAEPGAADAMRRKPRPAARLFDREILLRGLLQGGGLLLLLSGFYLLLRGADADADAAARTAAFLALILANLGLIYANISWRQLRWRRGGGANRYFVGGSLLALLLLALVLGIAPVRSLFGFALPGREALLAGALLAALSVAWFEAVNAATRRWLRKV